ncbi:SDR family NAD(P)-dependent oxidoreductase [Plantactinospora solaniradicis]|uniref:SDR family NAD(P)-dependent oxidoreductase n=1 Tax=Plantactinospora solaniradicis TaxID=1723736 RepID=A0ABW1KNT5_9ACTN
MDLGLANKRAIVTGGSAGIGKAIARQLVAEGVHCAVSSRSLDRARTATADLTGPGRALPVQAELRDAESVEAMVRQVTEEFGGVDILVNNGAVVSGNQAEDFDHITDELILTSFEEKFLGTMRCCRAVVPLMRAQGFGRIINIAGHKAREGGAIAAGARNSAIVHLTRSLALELGRDGITVNAVHPFTTVTETLESRMAEVAKRRGVTLEEHLGHVAGRTALGRLVTAPEIAAFVAFLASPLSVAMTGEVVALTGGVDRTIHG